jgi:hypothetical protein
MLSDGSGDCCPMCGGMQMPTWDDAATARACQNPNCGYVQERYPTPQALEEEIDKG